MCVFMPVARTVLRNRLSLSQNSFLLLLPCLHFFQFPFLCQSVYSGDCFGRFLPLWLKSYSLTYIFLSVSSEAFFSVSLSDSMPAGRVSALRCLLTSPSLSFVSIHPFIPPSSQSLPVLPGGCALVGQWNDSVLCCFWDPARLRLLQQAHFRSVVKPISYWYLVLIIPTVSQA